MWNIVRLYVIYPSISEKHLTIFSRKMLIINLESLLVVWNFVLMIFCQTRKVIFMLRLGTWRCAVVLALCMFLLLWWHCILFKKDWSKACIYTTVVLQHKWQPKNTPILSVFRWLFWIFFQIFIKLGFAAIMFWNYVPVVNSFQANGPFL